MGKFIRIPDADLKAAGKALDDLPDKTLGKTREEAVEELNAQIVRALEKGYTIKEITEILARGNVSIPAAVIRAKVVALKSPARKKPETKAKRQLTHPRPLPRRLCKMRKCRAITRLIYQIRSYDYERKCILHWRQQRRSWQEPVFLCAD